MLSTGIAVRRNSEHRIVAPTIQIRSLAGCGTSSRGTPLNTPLKNGDNNNKKKIERPPEEWQIFKDTHSAIIDREVFALVQQAGAAFGHLL